MHHKGISIFLIRRPLADHKKNWSSHGACLEDTKDSEWPSENARYFLVIHHNKNIRNSGTIPAQASNLTHNASNLRTQAMCQCTMLVFSPSTVFLTALVKLCTILELVRTHFATFGAKKSPRENSERWRSRTADNLSFF